VESDPIGLGGGINTYVYALNNPKLFVDQDGQNPAQFNAAFLNQFRFWFRKENGFDPVQKLNGYRNKLKVIYGCYSCEIECITEFFLDFLPEKAIENGLKRGAESIEREVAKQIAKLTIKNLFVVTKVVGLGSTTTCVLVSCQNR
jgi:hypothetical protein